MDSEQNMNKLKFEQTRDKFETKQGPCIREN